LTARRRRGRTGGRRPAVVPRYPAHVLAQIRALAEADPDREVCGFVVRRGGGAVEVVAVRNAIGPGPAPPGLPADPRRGYLADPVEQLRLVKQLRREGGSLLAAYHSHVGGGASFSGVDREFALSEGRPLWPGLDYLVVAVRSGSAGEIRKFSWNGDDFEGSALVPPAPAARAGGAP